MKKFTLAALAALVAAEASVANARDDEPSPDEIKEFASNYARQLSQQKLSQREIANQLASTIIWLEKVQLICPSYYYVNARRARFDYLLRGDAAGHPRQMLTAYKEPIAKIVEQGFDRETVMKVERMLHLAEYKRRQAAPGVKVTLRNFGRDRRYPIVNRFRDSGAPLPEPDRALVKNVAAKSEAFDF
jgi:hypothetical protein